ncbi:MAG: hypothetical protein FD180_3446 [Planctomycetota bacterium]|nr:MAG: hypothetical protein FD180_3446 [Planctomycetota bacterium]
MKKTATVVLALSALALAAPPDRTVWNTIKPLGSPKAVKLVLAGKPLTYYTLDGEGIGTRVKGPSRLRISVRGHFGQGDANSREITLNVAMDGGDAKGTKLKCLRSKTASYAEGAEGESPGGREELILDVPQGEHIFSAKTDARASGAFAIPSTKKKILRTEMTPTGFEKAVAEVFQERERTWYFATQEKPVTLEVTGPTTLKLYTALNFNSSMRTATEWKLEALLDGAVAAEKTWKSSRSQTRSYPDEKSVVPGQMETIDLAIPEGRHKIEVRPRGTLSAAVRILIPTGDLDKIPKK